MIPLGVLASARAAAGGGITATYLGTIASASNTSTYTFTSVPLAGSGYQTVLLINARGSTSTAVTSLTVAGSSGWGGMDAATPTVSVGAIEAWRGVTSATSGTVVVALSAGMLRATLSTWAIPLAATFDDSDGAEATGTLTLSATIASGGVGMVGVSGQAAWFTGLPDWDDGTGRYSAAVETLTFAAADYAVPKSGVTLAGGGGSALGLLVTYA